MIAEVTPDETRQMKEFLDNTEIRVEHVDNGITFDIIVTLYKGIPTPRSASPIIIPISC